MSDKTRISDVFVDKKRNIPLYLTYLIRNTLINLQQIW